MWETSSHRVGSTMSPWVAPTLWRQDGHRCSVFCRLPFFSVLLPSRSSPLVVRTLMKCILEPASAVSFWTSYIFFPSVFKGNRCCSVIWVPLRLKLIKRSIYAYLQLNWQKRRLIGTGNKSLLFPLVNIFINKSDLTNILQSFSGELKTIMFLYKPYSVGMRHNSQCVHFKKLALSDNIEV